MNHKGAKFTKENKNYFVFFVPLRFKKLSKTSNSPNLLTSPVMLDGLIQPQIALNLA
jgi:hypothetical protein